MADLWVSYRSGFRSEPVLRGADLTAPTASVTALVGRNGAGKTTLLRSLLGFLSADRGECTVDGVDSRRYRQTTGVGYVPESLGFPPAWTVRDILAWGADLTLLSSSREVALAEALDLAGVAATDLTREANRCSKGIQQRVKLAFALLGQPRLLILDEPFSGLDPAGRKELRATVRETKQRGATVLVASHELAEVARMADGAFVLDRGRTRPVAPRNGDRAAFERDLEQAVLGAVS